MLSFRDSIIDGKTIQSYMVNPENVEHTAIRTSKFTLTGRRVNRYTTSLLQQFGCKRLTQVLPLH